jgi:hypothetical protein
MNSQYIFSKLRKVGLFCPSTIDVEAGQEKSCEATLLMVAIVNYRLVVQYPPVVSVQPSNITVNASQVNCSDLICT